MSAKPMHLATLSSLSRGVCGKRGREGSTTTTHLADVTCEACMEVYPQLFPEVDYLYTPENCPSKHWNNGADVCDDCGESLQ